MHVASEHQSFGCILLDAINNGVVKSESKYQPHKSSHKTKIKTNVLLIALSLSQRIKARSIHVYYAIDRSG